MLFKPKPQGDQHNTVDMDPQVSVAHQKTKEEKWFIFKLDACLMTFACISQIIKYLDQNNITVAYVSGMQEALNLTGNELNFFTTYFNIGYCIFLVPSQVMLTHFRPSLWLSGLELVWGLLTLGIAFCTSAKQVYVLRVFIGLAESSAYCGAITILMAWYSPPELAKRIGFYHSTQAMGGLISNALQTAISASLVGKHGVAGWQWTFIINAIMTVCIAMVGPFMIPDFPTKPNPMAIWIKAGDQDIALDRLTRFTRKSPKPIDMKAIMRSLRSPIAYGVSFVYIALVMAPQGVNYFQLWLKSLTKADGSVVWTTSQLTAIPLAGFALQIGSVWAYSWGSDYFKTRWLMLMIMVALGIPSCIIMTVWNVPDAAKYYSYFMLYVCTAVGPPLWAWMSDMLPRDAEQRALILGFSITIYYAINAWANVLIWPASQAPHYLYGWQVTLGLWIAGGLVICLLRAYDLKVVRPENYRCALEAHRAETEGEAIDAKNGEEEMSKNADDRIQVVPAL